MPRIKLSFFGLAAALTVAAGTSAAHADLYFVGDGGTSTTAGNGAWSNFAPNQWSDTSGGTANSPWVSGDNAVFEGTVGGTVTNADEVIDVNNVNYSPGAGQFTVVNNSTFDVNGAGITNSSGTAQNYTNNGALNFTNNASAGLAGTVAIDNSAGLGTITFSGSSQGGTASLTNEGGSTTNFFTLTSTGLTIAALDNAGGAIKLGEKDITAVSLTLEDTVANNVAFSEGDGLYFTLGQTNGILNATSSMTASGQTDIYVATDVAYFAGLPEYTLIDSEGGPLSLSNYVLDSGPAGYALGLSADQTELELVAVPEVSSFAIPMVLGAAGFFWLRRRRSMLSLPLEA